MSRRVAFPCSPFANTVREVAFFAVVALCSVSHFARTKSISHGVAAVQHTNPSGRPRQRGGDEACGGRRSERSTRDPASWSAPRRCAHGSLSRARSDGEGEEQYSLGVTPRSEERRLGPSASSSCRFRSAMTRSVRLQIGGLTLSSLSSCRSEHIRRYFRVLHRRRRR